MMLVTACSAGSRSAHGEQLTSSSCQDMTLVRQLMLRKGAKAHSNGFQPVCPDLPSLLPNSSASKMREGFCRT